VTGTVGNVGRPRAVSAPRLATIDDALSLLRVLGTDNPQVHSLLEELRAAIEHNARLVDDATAKLRAQVVEDSAHQGRDRQLAIAAMIHG
jgi:dihydroorotate dehydrogenase